MEICIWSLLIIEPCSTCSQVYHSDCSVTADPTNQILLIIFTPSKMSRESWLFKSWNIEAEDLIITLKTLKVRKVFFYDNDGYDDDNNNDDKRKESVTILIKAR